MSKFNAAKPAQALKPSSLVTVRHARKPARVQQTRFTPSVLALALASALALPGAALADTWLGTVSDDWMTGGNWNSGVPAANADIIVDTAPNPATLGTAGVVAGGLYVGSVAGSTGFLVIQNGGTLTSSTASIGAAADASGAVLVDGAGSSWQGPDHLRVGAAGTGTLTILNGAAVGDDDGFVGYMAGSTGTVAVMGTGGGASSSWIHNNNFFIGASGTGTVVISAGGFVSNVHAFVGNTTGSTGAVSIDGQGSTWANSGTLVVGRSGQGTLAITGGGVVSAATSVVGEQAGGQGTASVSGKDSAWNHSADLFVGFAGDGALTIANGATVTDVTGYVGGVAGGTGTVQVMGQGSTWTNTGGLAVGNFGAGTLAVSNGGKVLSLASALGNYSGSSGAATVDGPGSAWLNDAVLYVGNEGSGALVVSNGGAVTNTLAIVGHQAGSSGSALVDGKDSTWTSSSDVYVGSGGTGTLSIANGGAVSNVAAYIGHLASGAATVDGKGSSWTSSASLVVGSSAAGTLAITGGGVVNSDQGYVGSTTAGTGTVTIDGTGSAWNNKLDLRVGEQGGGTLNILNGGAVNNANAYVGNQAGSTGTVNVGGANALWTSAGNLYVGTDGSGTLNIGKGGTVKDDIGVLGFAGTGTATVDGAGAAWLSGAELYIGYGGTGTLTIANGGLVGVAGAFVSIAGLAGATGTLNIGGAAGAAATAPGTLSAPLVQFGAGSGALNFNHTDTSGNYDFSARVGGVGTLNHNAGWTIMSGDSSGFTGTANVNGGRLAVNGSLAGAQVNVNNGGILGGNGFVGNTFANAGGTIAPGNSIGTLNVNGNVTFAAGSFYQVETNPAGQSDNLLVSGTATLNGGTVQVIGGSGNYSPATSYSILTAQGGVTGTFAGVTSDLFLMDPSLSYTATGVSLTLTRNSTTFSSVSQSVAQSSVGASAQGLGPGNPIYNAVLALSAPQARYAFEQLSGEAHTSARSVQLEDSRFARDVSLERLRSLDSESLANDGGADAAEGKPARLLPSLRELAYWGRAMGSWGRIDGDAGAATVQRDTAGFVMGADTRLGDEGHLGLMGGYSRSTFDVNDRNSSGSSDNYHLAAYAGNRWGDLALRAGVTYSWHDVSTSRVVAFPGFSGSLQADYKAATTQAFAEFGYRIKTAQAELEPFANLAHVNVASDGFTEHGGAAALSSAGHSSGVTFSTLGLRASTNFSLNNGTSVTARGSLGWRQASGDTTPATTLSFAGGSPFAINGVPIAKSAAVVEAGLDFKLSNAATLGLSYGGQFGSGLRDQNARIHLNVAF